MITSGKLSERVSILLPETTRGAHGEQNTEYIEAARVWANVIFQRGAQALSVGDVWLNRSVVVTMRRNKVVTERCRLLWDGKEYVIESLNRSAHDGSITITASLMEDGNG
jgi:head-tail adaptor